MKFSVLIPVYNTEKYLDECIQSVLSQTYQDFEIILVDDGSTDRSGTICEKYKKAYPERIRVIHQENRGQLASRCRAILEATGDYCVFVDADDLLVNNALETIAQKLEDNHNPDMLVYSFYYESEDGSQRKADKLFSEGIVPIEEFYRLFFTGTGLNNVWTKAVKRDVALCKGFDFTPYYHLRCAEDKLHSMIMVDKCNTVAYIYEPLYRYRLFEGSVTRRYCVTDIEKFSSAALYPIETEYLKKWGMELPEWQFRLDARSAREVLYVFDLYYKNTRGQERQQVLQYDWSSFLSRDTIIGLQDNPYLGEIHKRLWRWIMEKDYRSLKSYFMKKNLRKRIKSFLK